MSHIVAVDIGGTQIRIALGQRLFKPFEESLRKHTFHPHYLEDRVVTRAALGALALAWMQSA
jgi:hypothetical protein